MVGTASSEEVVVEDSSGRMDVEESSQNAYDYRCVDFT